MCSPAVMSCWFWGSKRFHYLAHKSLPKHIQILMTDPPKQGRNSSVMPWCSQQQMPAYGNFLWLATTCQQSGCANDAGNGVFCATWFPEKPQMYCTCCLVELGQSIAAISTACTSTRLEVNKIICAKMPCTKMSNMTNEG
eukprot:6463700-Amphidinium_carterae.6